MAVRMLFTFIGGHGHCAPLIQVARAAESAGHTVAFGCGPSMVETVAAAGFTAYPLGLGRASPPERLPLRPLDAEREDQEFRDRFARQGARSRVPHTLALCAEWRPEVLICDEADFGGMVAAERLGLLHATVLVMAAGSFVRAHVVGAALNELRAENNLPPDPTLEMLRRYLVLAPFPPRFRDPAFPLPATGYSFCPHKPATIPAAPPVPAAWSPDTPLVYFTLGTVFNLESGDLFLRVLAGLRDLPVNTLTTLGPHLDPADLGPQPANIHIERYIAQESLLPHCRLVVSHGGSGSVIGALAHGLPSLLIPMGADQPLNAGRAQQLGTARVLDPIQATPEAVRSAVAALLENPAYRPAAERIRDEFITLPGPGRAVELLQQLVAERRPLVRENC